MYLFDLGKEWEVRFENLAVSRDCYQDIYAKDDGQWMAAASLPCDVHLPLMEKGIIGDPVIADNCYQSEWIEDKSWWFKKVFRGTRELLEATNSELVLEGLDAEADIFLNNYYLGHHRSSTYPYRKDVRDLLHDGNNILVVRVTSGLEYVSEFDMAGIKNFVNTEQLCGRGERGDSRRVFVRKPAYVYGWDWNPRIATCGIMGGARIEAFSEIAIRSSKLTTQSIEGNDAKISIEIELENLNPITTIDAMVDLDISFEHALVYSAQKEVFMTAGYNYILFEMVIRDARLWWPNGMGAQDLYQIRITAKTDDDQMDSYEFLSGIRTVNLDLEKMDEGRRFAVVINGRKVFCKGANWETPDSLYARITDDKYQLLVQEAVAANFNMFRVNGVGAYERDFFYECCDRYGILLWQDFAFSCAAYPDGELWFSQEVEAEIDHQTKRLRNHPSLALWCGSNECQWVLSRANDCMGNYWAGNKKPDSPGGILIYNSIIPQTIRRNCWEIPYWNSSPFGGYDLNCTTLGDSHCWDDHFMNSDMDKRITPQEYDKVKCRFVSEFGCIGPTKKSSLYRYYGSDQIEVGSEIWKLHTNKFEKNTVEAAIRKHYLGAREYSLEEYLLYAGLFQGLMLGYALESMRLEMDNYGALFWSYSDCWGEVGWSIIDYYLTRKISYYFVKRAFADVMVAMRQEGEHIVIYGLNDGHKDISFDLEYGYTSFDGSDKDVQKKKVLIPGFCKVMVLETIKEAAWDAMTGIYYAKPGCRKVAPAILRTVDYRQLKTTKTVLEVSNFAYVNSCTSFDITSSAYAHAVHFNLDDSYALSDDYFDLLPGETRHIKVFAKLQKEDIKPQVLEDLSGCGEVIKC